MIASSPCNKNRIRIKKCRFYISKCCAVFWNECGKLYFLLHTICVYCLWWLILCQFQGSFWMRLNFEQAHCLLECRWVSLWLKAWMRKRLASLSKREFSSWLQTSPATLALLNFIPSGPWYRCGLTISHEPVSTTTFSIHIHIQ